MAAAHSSLAQRLLPRLVAYRRLASSHALPFPRSRADVRGIAGYAFVDFGDAFTVRDATGEPVKNAIIASIMPAHAPAAAAASSSSSSSSSSTAPAPAALTVYVVEGKRIEFSDGDHVVFREVAAYPWLNDGQPRRISGIDIKARSFNVELLAGDAVAEAAASAASAASASASGGASLAGGLVEQVKVPTTVAFGSLAERIVSPLPPGEGMGA